MLLEVQEVGAMVIVEDISPWLLVCLMARLLPMDTQATQDIRHMVPTPTGSPVPTPVIRQLPPQHPQVLLALPRLTMLLPVLLAQLLPVLPVRLLQAHRGRPLPVLLVLLHLVLPVLLELRQLHLLIRILAWIHMPPTLKPILGMILLPFIGS